MPAMVVPQLDPFDAGVWLLACPECNWYPDRYFDEAIAKQDAYQHNAEHHDGAGVEFTPQMALSNLIADQRWILRQVRNAQLVVAGTVLLYSVLMLIIFGWLAGLLFAVYGAVVYRQSTDVGKWKERATHQGLVMQRMRDAFGLDD